MKRARGRSATVRIALLGLAAGLLLAAGVVVRGQSSEQFKVVVNGANPSASLSAAELSRIFLKRVEHWESGLKMLPIDLPVTSPARESFSQSVHGRRAAAIKSYWQQQIYSGRGVPPPEGGSDEEVVAYVRANAGAIGYVSAAAKTDGVKVIAVGG